MRQCIVYKQCSANHNISWKQRLVTLLSKKGYHVEGDNTYTNAEGNTFKILENDVSYELHSDVIPDIDIFKAISTMYDHESSGLTVDTGKVAKEIAQATLVISGLALATGIIAKLNSANARTAMGFAESNKDYARIARNQWSRTDGLVFSDEMFVKLSQVSTSGKDVSAEATKVIQQSMAAADFSPALKSEMQEVLNWIEGNAAQINGLNPDKATNLIYTTVKNVNDSVGKALYDSVDIASQELQAAAINNIKAAVIEQNVNKSVLPIAGAALTGSAIVAVLTNVTHKRPLVNTEYGVRVVMRYPTTVPITNAALQEFSLREVSDMLGGKAEIVDGSVCINTKAAKLYRILIDARITDGVVTVQSWVQSSLKKGAKEKDFPAELCSFGLRSEAIFNAFKSRFLTKPTFEIPAELSISVDPLEEEL